MGGEPFKGLGFMKKFFLSFFIFFCLSSSYVFAASDLTLTGTTLVGNQNSYSFSMMQNQYTKHVVYVNGKAFTTVSNWTFSIWQGSFTQPITDVYVTDYDAASNQEVPNSASNVVQVNGSVPSPTPSPTPSPSTYPAPQSFVCNTNGTNNALCNWAIDGWAKGYNIYVDGQLVGSSTDLSHGGYTVQGLSDGNHVISVKSYDAGGIESDAASTSVTVGNASPLPSPTPSPTPAPDPVTVAIGQCANQICQCISALSPALDQINQNTHGILNQMANVISSIDDVKKSVDAVKDQLQPIKDYPIKSIDDYQIPKLEDNKPLMHESGKFEDTKTYFTDQGDAAEPPSLPVAPDPVTEWKDALGNTVKKQSSMHRDEVKKRSPVLHRDPVMQKDNTKYDLRWNSDQYRGG